VELVPDLDFQDAAAPAVGDSLLDVKIPGGGVFDPLNDLKNMSPRQLRNDLLRNWPDGKFKCNVLHCQQVAC